MKKKEENTDIFLIFLEIRTTLSIRRLEIVAVFECGDVVERVCSDDDAFLPHAATDPVAALLA
jgi:hypothetical protein